MAFFPYDEIALAYLAGRDPKLGEAIRRIGKVERAINPDLFQALVNSIVGQQISTKAQVTIWNRMLVALGEITPAVILGLSDQELQRFGISFRKAAYIKGAAEAVAQGRLDLEGLHQLPDQEVCRQLSALPGIGVWTAEMLMTFSMARPDLLSFGDLAIHRGMRMLYRHRNVDKKLFEKYRRRYSPYGSVASLYLWAIAGGALPELTDPGAAKAKPKPTKKP